MGWTTPGTFAVGQVLAAASLNAMTANDAALYAPLQRIAYTTQSATGTVATTAAAPVNRLFSSGISFTAAASTTYLVEFYVPWSLSAVTAGAYNVLYLCDSTGTILTTTGGNAIATSPIGNGTQAGQCCLYGKIRWTPGAGAKTLNLGATHAVAAGTIGSSASTALATLAVYGPDLT